MHVPVMQNLVRNAVYQIQTNDLIGNCNWSKITAVTNIILMSFVFETKARKFFCHKNTREHLPVFG